MFQNIRINIKNYSYEKYMTDLIKQVTYIGSFNQNEIIYLTKDVPLFHCFYSPALLAFRYFFWMKTRIQHPDFEKAGFEFSCVSPEAERLSIELAQVYTRVPSTEIWNTECINAPISQIEFYKDSGYFASAADIKKVYDSLEETILHLKLQVEYGCKFMPSENPGSKKSNFKFFYNRIILGDNTILVVTDNIKSVYINYDSLNYMVTRDVNFCNPFYDDLLTLTKKSTLISHTGEKQRNSFFGIIMNKITERKKRL